MTKTPMTDAYHAAEAARAACAAAVERTLAATMCECDTLPCAHEAAYDAAVDLMDAAVDVMDAAAAAMAESDEPRAWSLRDEGAEWTVTGTLAQARADAHGIDYDAGDDTFWSDIAIYDPYTDAHVETVTIQVDPDAPACVDAAGHTWRTPVELVGGSKDNPGCWGHGGGSIQHEACVRCGCRRTTDTWAHRPDTGEQGMTSVSYDAHYYDLRDWRE